MTKVYTLTSRSIDFDQFMRSMAKVILYHYFSSKLSYPIIDPAYYNIYVLVSSGLQATHC